MQEIVINTRAGGFGLSDKAKEMYKYWSGKNYPEDLKTWASKRKNRDDPILIVVIHALCDEANGKYAKLKVIEIPDDVDWEIQSGDNGVEWVAEVCRYWT